MNEARPRLRAYLAWLFAVAGLVAIGWLAQRAGLARLRGAAMTLLPWLPAIAALEGARWLADTWATWLLYGGRAATSSRRRLLAATLRAYTVILLLPAGRFGGEIVKATAMHRDVGMPLAAATAVRMQALPLLAGAVVSVPAVVAALVWWGPTWLTGAIALQMLTAVGLGGAILAGARRPVVGELLRRVSAKLGAAAVDVQAELRAGPALPLGALAAAVIHRGLVVAQIIVLAHAIGVPRGVVGGLLAAGLHLVGMAAGDLVPAQLGATDAALVLGAEALGTPASGLVAAALVVHITQLAWAALGALAWLLPTRRDG